MIKSYYRILESIPFSNLKDQEPLWRFHWCQPENETMARQDFENIVKTEKNGLRYRLVKIEVLNES